MLLPLFPMHWSKYSAWYAVHWCNLPICVDDLIKELVILWCYNCAEPYRMWLVLHVVVTTHHLTVLTSTYLIHKHSVSFDEYQWVQFCLHGRIQIHAVVSYAFPCQKSFHQTASLLPLSHSNKTERNIGGKVQLLLNRQRNKIGSITFGAALINIKFYFKEPTNIYVFLNGTCHF